MIIRKVSLIVLMLTVSLGLLLAQNTNQDSMLVLVYDDYSDSRYNGDVRLTIEMANKKSIICLLDNGKGKIPRSAFTNLGEVISWEPDDSDEQDDYYKERKENPYLDYFKLYTDEIRKKKPKEYEKYERIIPLYRKYRSPETTTATRRNDRSFGLTNSITVLTRERILAAGCTSIPEALRLVPGVLVREQTNGNFDVHIRGLDNIPPSSTFLLSTNTSTLVMINGRPVYSYFSGGTFWETLPIDINDVQQIDVMRGASAVLYGPNAGTGVINIVTRTNSLTDKQILSEADWYVSGNASSGFSPGGGASFSEPKSGLPGGTSIVNLSAVKRFDKGDNTSHAGVSVNYQNRKRHDDRYFNFGTATKNIGGAFVPRDSLVTRQGRPLSLEDFPEAALALDKIGANAFFNLDYGIESRFRINVGLEFSESQKIYSDDQMNPLLGYNSRTGYADVLWNHVHKLSDKKEIYFIPNIQASYLSGDQFIGGDVGYKFANADVLGEVMLEEYLDGKTDHYYRISINYNFRDARYTTQTDRTTILSPDNIPPQEKIIQTNAVVGRLEYQLYRMNLIAGYRSDYFNKPEKPYESYQFGISFNLLGAEQKNHKLLLRGMFGQAYRAPILTDLYFDQSYGASPSPFRQRVTGVDSLNLLRLRTLDAGLRWQYLTPANATLFAEVELFQVKANDFTDAVIGTNFQDGNLIVSPATFQNIPLSVRQRGISLQLGGELLRKRLNINANLTYQTTQLSDYSPFLNVSGAPGLSPGSVTVQQFGNPPFKPNTNTEHWQNTVDTLHRGTPKWIGGLDATLRTKNKKWAINGGLYFIGDQVFIHRNQIYYVQDNRAITYIPSKINFHFKLARVLRLQKGRNIEFYISGRSLGISTSENETPYLSRPNTEYAWGDQIRAGYIVGLRFEL